MRRVLFLFFLFFIELIISSTIKILSENLRTNYTDKNFPKNNDIQIFPEFYTQTNMNNYKFYFNNTMSNSNYEINVKELNKLSNDEKLFYLQKFESDTKEENETGILKFSKNKSTFISNNLEISDDKLKIIALNIKKIELNDFLQLLPESTRNKRNLQNVNNKCLEFNDCFNCTSYSDRNVDCYWFQGSCMNNTNPTRVRNWWNYFDTCIRDFDSVDIMSKYCGNLEFDSVPLSIELNQINNVYGTPYLFCSYTVNLNDITKLVSINYADTVLDRDSTFVLQVTYIDGSIINKTLPSRLEWILHGVISLKLHYFTRRSFTRLPFKLDISYETSNNNYLGLFVSLGVVVFICLICSACFYKCSKIIIENAHRRLDQRRRLNLHQPNLNLIPSEEENIRRTNQESLKKLLETDLKPMKYNEQINHFHTNCTICLEEFNSSMDVIFLFCKHIFHFKCLKDWLERNILMPKCPNCNYNVLTGGVIDLHPNQNIENNQNNNANNELNFNNNQIININRNPNNSEINNNPASNGNGENNIINIIQSDTKENQRQVNNPNYIENQVEAVEINNIVITNFSSRKKKENENRDKINQNNHGYSRIDINTSPINNYNSNDSKKIEINEPNYNSNGKNDSQIYIASQEKALNEIENLNVNQNDVDNMSVKNFDSKKMDKIDLISGKERDINLIRPPPNRPPSLMQNKQHNNFIVKEKNNLNNDISLNNSKNSVLNNIKENILTEESKKNDVNPK